MDLKSGRAPEAGIRDYDLFYFDGGALRRSGGACAGSVESGVRPARRPPIEVKAANTGRSVFRGILGGLLQSKNGLVLSTLGPPRVWRRTRQAIFTAVPLTLTIIMPLFSPSTS